MSATIHADAVPLRLDEGGNVRVGDSRVTLRVVVDQYLDGASAEQIAERFDTLQLADVYAALAYFLRHRPELDEQFAQDDRDSEAFLRGLGSAYRTAADLRPQLEARRAASLPGG